MKGRTSWVKASVAMGLLWALTALQSATAQTATEDQIKAAYVFNFAKFVAWPVEAFSSAASPMNFCIFGRDQMADELGSLIAGKSINGHPVKIRRLGKAEPTTECHLLFVAAGRGKQQQQLLQAAKGLPVLLVGDAPGFALSGGMIGLITENGKVVFEVNPGPAEESHLKISSKLLALARIVGKSTTNPSD